MACFQGVVVAEVADDESDMYISNNPDELFYHVPRRMLSFVDGCPSMLTVIALGYDEENDRLVICANEDEEHKARFTISFPLDKLFKNITLEGISAKDIEDTLFATNDR